MKVIKKQTNVKSEFKKSEILWKKTNNQYLVIIYVQYMCTLMLMYDYTKSHIQTVTLRQCADLYDYNPRELTYFFQTFVKQLVELIYNF